MKRKILITFTLLGIISIAFGIWGIMASNVEQPQYEVISSDQGFETRTYNPTITAEILVDGSRKDAIKKGFKQLAGYIFGHNKPANSIKMTAPVMQEESTTIAMTAPVSQSREGKQWKVSFTMPAHYSMDTLPDPNNSNVKLTQIPKRTVLVLRFSGSTSEENIYVHAEKLLKYLKKEGIKTTGSVQYAFYNPPWTLPLLRRNEIMIALQE